VRILSFTPAGGHRNAMSYRKITAQQEDGLIHFHASGKKFTARKSLRLDRRVALQDQSKKAPTAVKPEKIHQK
jgi:hypothetical protein